MIGLVPILGGGWLNAAAIAKAEHARSGNGLASVRVRAASGELLGEVEERHLLLAERRALPPIPAAPGTVAAVAVRQSDGEVTVTRAPLAGFVLDPEADAYLPVVPGLRPGPHAEAVIGVATDGAAILEPISGALFADEAAFRDFAEAELASRPRGVR